MASTSESRIAFPDASHDETSTPSGNASSLAWHSRTKIHQSSVKAMCSLPLTSSTNVVVTGGDDGALGFTRVTYSNNSFNTKLTDHHQQPLLSCSVLLIPNAHAAAITAITYLRPSPSGTYNSSTTKTKGDHHDQQTQQHNFATTGPDQRLQLWHVSFDLTQPGVEGLRVEKGQGVNTAVADAACLEVLSWVSEEGYKDNDYCDDDNHDDNIADNGHDEQNDKEEKKNKNKERLEPTIATPQPSPSENQPQLESESDAQNQITLIQNSILTPKTNIFYRQQQQQLKQKQKQKQQPLRILVAGIGLEVRKLARVSSASAAR